MMRRNTYCIIAVLLFILPIAVCGAKREVDLLSREYAKFIQGYPGGAEDFPYETRQLHISIALKLAEVGNLYSKIDRDQDAVVKYEEALVHYATGDIYYGYANSLYKIMHLDSALLSYKIAGALGYEINEHIYYQIARIYSRLEKKQLAFEYLDIAIMNGFRDENQLQQDPDLEFVHSQQEWHEWFKQRKALFRPPISNLRSWLVVEYPFDENAHDNSGNGHHGTVYGATLTNDRFGALNSAFYFDGINDFIEIGHLPTIKESNEVTICYWFSLTDHTGFDVCGYISGYRKKALRLGLDPQRRIFINPGTHTDIHSSNVTFNLQRWYHYAMTVKGGESVRVYVNGKMVFQTSSGVPDILEDPPCFSIGAGNEFLIGRSRAHYTNGIIDEFQIYNRVLSEDEIKHLYNLTKAK
ncbi:LamG domain-containing protein [candidate division WOR-3 bacterium]|nr:LamG domain-containing protein [candidate division WOR-3 bacterium]